MPASNQSTIPKIILSIFLAVAVLMLTIAAISAVSSGRALAREITAPGTVVDLAIRQATDGTLYYRPVVAFALPDGDRRTLQVAEESTDPVYKVDQAVTIAYDPARPDNARINPPRALSACGFCRRSWASWAQHFWPQRYSLGWVLAVG